MSGLMACRLALVAVFLAALPTVVAAKPRLSAEGTEFVLHLDGGRVLRSADLVGAKLMIDVGGTIIGVTIATVEDDPTAVGGKVFLHRLLIDEDGKPADMCAADPDGRHLGFPVPDGKGGFTLTCTAGAVGKCIRWGYRPWDEKAGGPPLKALHEACVHMVRADYGGDGQSTTRDGTPIDFCDRFGITPCTTSTAMAFEAGWGVRGATCVAHPRIAANISLAQIAKAHPGLAGHLGPVACTMATALADPDALLFDRSAD